MAAKREIALAGVEVCDLAMEVAGGAAFFKGSRDRARPTATSAPPSSTP